MTRSQLCIPLALVLAAVAGCGGGSGGGAVTAVTRALTGELQWPAALGTVNVTSVSVLEVRPGEGIVETPLATGTASGRTYEVPNVPESPLAVVRVTGEASGGIAVRLAAIIGQAVSRSRQTRVTLHLSPGRTIAAAAVEKMVRISTDTSAVTPARLTALETESDTVAATVDLASAPRIDAAAVDVLSTTQNNLASLDVPTYFPVRAGNSYTYAVTDATGRPSTRTDIFGTQTTFAGSLAMPLERGDGGKTYFAPSAAAHLRVLGRQSADGTVTAVSLPPMLIPNTLVVGQPLTQTYDSIVTSASSVQTIPHSVTITLEAYEPVTVPAGTFKHCAKLTVTRTATFAGGQTNTFTETWYLAPGIGQIKWMESGGVIEELESAVVGGAQVAWTSLVASDTAR